eukprot:11385119-Heterocapsa_arctica.AAC.1
MGARLVEAIRYIGIWHKEQDLWIINKMEAIKAMVQSKVPLAFEEYKDMETDLNKLRGSMSEGTVLVRRWSTADNLMPEEEEAFTAELEAWGQDAR